MVNYPVLIINKTQLNISIWSKDGHNAHFSPPYINLKLNMYMKRDINILVKFSIH